MKLICISDTHCQLEDITIPEGDVLIHTGDLTYRGTIEEINKELKILQKLKKRFSYILFTPGNHDWLFEKNYSLAEQMCLDVGVTVVHEKTITINDINFYGTAYQPEFCNWAFNVPRNNMKQIWDRIPDNTNVLLTHTPPQGILDRCPNGFRAGCEELKKKIAELSKKQLRCNIFGHIHVDQKCNPNNMSRIDKMCFVNASICNNKYKPVNSAVIVEI